MNLDEIRRALKDQRLDGWLFFDHHHRDPLAYRILGIDSQAQASRRWYYYIPADGEPRKLVHRIESGILDSLAGTSTVYSRWTEQREGLRHLIGNASRVAMQYSPECAVPYISLVDGGTLELVRGLGVEVASAADLVQQFEARWTEAQLESHLEAGRRMDKLRAAAFRHITDSLNAGQALTEWQVRSQLLDWFAANDLVTDHGPIVAVNGNASDPHYEPTATAHRPIRRGDFVLIDMWAKLDRPGSVYYDITWTGFCGPDPPDEMQRVFGIVAGARDRAVDLVQRRISAGETLHGYEVDDAARSHIASFGLGDFFVHRTGHSIGEDVHGSGANMDNFETHDDRRVLPGTCFSIEPGVYLPEFGIRSEVDVFAGAGTARVTGEVQRELLRLL